MMNKKTAPSTWNTINQLWQTHQENPKFSNDLSTILIIDKQNQESELAVNHSFILANHNKLMTICPNIVCIHQKKSIPIQRFNELTISNKYKLPKAPIEFHEIRSNISNRDTKTTKNKKENQEIFNIELTDPTGGLSNLIPFGSKITENKTEPLLEETKNKKYRYIKILTGIFAPIVLLTIIYYIVTSPTNDSNLKATNNPKANSKIDETEKSTTSVTNKAPIKKRENKKLSASNARKNISPASVSKNKSTNEHIQKNNTRRKQLMNKRSKILPASVDNNDAIEDEPTPIDHDPEFSPDSNIQEVDNKDSYQEENQKEEKFDDIDQGNKLDLTQEPEAPKEDYDADSYPQEENY